MAPRPNIKGDVTETIGTRGVTFTGTFAGLPEVVPGIDIKQTINAVKFGINYRF